MENVAAVFAFQIGSVALLGGGLVVFALVTGLMYVIFRMLKKSIKMAFRLAVVAAVLVIALAGGLSLWWFSSGDAPAQRPANTRKK